MESLRDVNEMTNLELIIDTLQDIWDLYPDYDPQSGAVADRTPDTHMILCTALQSGRRDVVKDWDMEPGQPMVLQVCIKNGPDHKCMRQNIF